MNFYIPNNLELDEHVAKYPPTGISYFKPIKLAYILDIMTSSAEKDLVNGYKNINAAMLKRRVDNYNEYLRYLV